MEKQASNTFVGGLITDRHPLASQNTELIEAQNIDLLAVGEGYQMILQKREGNELIPDGCLPSSTYVPLAVKEFNNVAYIVSVDTSTGKGEVGTFPSPDYDDFKYDKGSESPNGLTVGGPTWDRTADSAEFAFTISATSVAEETISGAGTAPYTSDTASNPTTLGATFILTNTGIQTDTFYLTMTGDTAGIVLYDGPAPYVEATGIVLAPGAHSDIRYVVSNPYGVTPSVTKTIVTTITPMNGSVASIKTFTCSYHTTKVMQVRKYINTYPWTTPPVPWSTTEFVESIAAAGVTHEYKWRSNVTTPSMTLTKSPGGAANITSAEYAGNIVRIVATANAGPGTKYAEFVLTEATAGAFSIKITQAAP